MDKGSLVRKQVMLETVVMPITYKCNCNCIMCSIPKKKTEDLSIEFYDRIFDDSNLNCIKSINITGGEPFLRDDVEAIVDIILKKCTNLKEIIFSTNGTIASSVARIGQIIKKNCTCSFIVSVSLDATNIHADEIRGLKDIYLKQMETIIQLADLKNRYNNVKIVAAMTITKRNYEDILPVFNWAKEHQILVDYIYATVNTTYIDSEGKKELFVLSDEENEKVIRDLSIIYRDRLIASDRVYYENLFEKLIYQTKSKRACMNYEKRGILIEANGNVRVCGMDKRTYLGNLLDETFTEIYQKKLPEMSEICETCLTNSYNAYTRKSQEQLKNEILLEVRRLRELKHEMENSD